jgi:hypothetical protein
VATVDETGAFGILISKNTFEIGVSPNDAEAAAEAMLASGAAPAGAGADQRVQLLQMMLQQQQAESQQRSAQQSYTVQQFVEPGQTQGIPSRFVGQPSGPIGGTAPKQ